VGLNCGDLAGLWDAGQWRGDLVGVCWVCGMSAWQSRDPAGLWSSTLMGLLSRVSAEQGSGEPMDLGPGAPEGQGAWCSRDLADLQNWSLVGTGGRVLMEQSSGSVELWCRGFWASCSFSKSWCGLEIPWARDSEC
jgi:hypothetical protein